MEKQMGTIEYSSNNSGGSWWLNDDNWKALEAGGWKVHWVKDDESFTRFFKPDSEGRWLGTLAKRASKEGVRSMAEGVADWEYLTGQCSTDTGCPCCGQPHSFTFTDDKGKVSYGPDVVYEARW
jgi:hypothetical protein